MNYLIMIDKSSIKKNDNAGSTVSYFSSSHNKIVEEYEYGKIVNGYLMEYVVDIQSNVGRNEYNEIRSILSNLKRLAESSEIVSDKDKKYLGKLKRKIESREIQKIRHEPIEKYSFKYLPTQIECKSCHSKFDYTELEEYCSEDGYFYSNKICPKCKEMDCCEIEYQDISEVI